jgi:hypothetical protein
MARLSKFCATAGQKTRWKNPPQNSKSCSDQLKGERESEVQSAGNPGESSMQAI